MAMNALNYAAQYSQALAQVFPFVLHFGALFATPNNGRYRWGDDGKTIYIPTIRTTGRVNADRDTIATAQRNYDNAWEPKVLANQRKWSTLVHPKDIDQTAMATSIQNITNVYNQEQKFPEMDAYCISKIFADWVAAGNTATAMTITAANALVQFDAMMQAMTEARVPATGRILYVDPPTKTALKNAEQISRNFDVQSRQDVIDRRVTSLDQVTVEEVPSELMKTVYNFTEGWAPGASAKQIHMLLVQPLAVITPVSYEFAQLDPPSAVTEGKFIYYEESHEDVFILNNKAAAIQFVTEA